MDSFPELTELTKLTPLENISTDVSMYDNTELLASIPDDRGVESFNEFDTHMDDNERDVCQRSPSTTLKRSRKVINGDAVDEDLEDLNSNETSSVAKKKIRRVPSAVVHSTVLQESELRNEIQLNVCDLTGEFVAPIVRPPEEIATTSAVRSNKKMQNHMLDALLGQAALLTARGRNGEAVAMLHEVIRQDPRRPQAYSQIAELYELTDELPKCFEYKLLALHMDRNADASGWNEAGEMAVELGRFKEAAACFEKASRFASWHWYYYQRRIAMLEKLDKIPLAMKTKLLAMENVDYEKSGLNFEWLDRLMREVVNYYTEANDSEKSMRALMCYFVRSAREGGMNTNQLDILTANLIHNENYTDVIYLTLGLCNSIRALNAEGGPGYEIVFHGGIVNVVPFPLTNVESFIVSPELPTVILGRLILSMIHTRNDFVVPSLIDIFVDREYDREVDHLYLDIGIAFEALSYEDGGFAYAEKLVRSATLTRCAHSWYLYGFYLEKTKGPDEALPAYEHVLELDNTYINARINMSYIHQRLGNIEASLTVLNDSDLRHIRRIPDERLLLRQSEVFLAQNRQKEYIRSLGLILIPHFHNVNKSLEQILKKRKTPTNKIVNITLRRAMFAALSRTKFEKTVIRLGTISDRDKRSLDNLPANKFHDCSMKLIEGLYNQKQYQEMLHVACYSALHPLMPGINMAAFINLVFFCSVKTHDYSIIFEYLRFTYLQLVNDKNLDEHKRKIKIRSIVTAMNYSFCHFQCVAQQRFISRLLIKNPDEMHFHIIAGNNSLMSGSYKNAIYEYTIAIKERPNDPIIHFNLAICFSALASRRDITKRTAVALRAMFFMAKYMKLRLPKGPSQEVYYNIGRMFQQIGLTTAAEYWYQKVLDAPDFSIYNEDERTGDVTMSTSHAYGMKALAALNLAFMMKTYNPGKARLLRRKYCVI